MLRSSCGKFYDISILGFGISSFCFLLYLHNRKLISRYRILICEEGSSPCLDSLNYKNVNSNSTLKSLLEPFRIEMFDEVLSEVDKVYNLDSYINLSDYNKIIKSLVSVFLEHLNKLDNIDIKFNFKVKNISHASSGIKIGTRLSKTCVISMGAQQDIDQLIAQDTDDLLIGNISKCILPHLIFTNQVDFQNFLNKKIGIIGSSHSSLSVVDALISKGVNPENISLLCRNDFKVFFNSREACLSRNFKFNEEDICTETQTVNRFDGLRENSKKIYLNLDKYGIQKIHRDPISCDGLDVIVPCWGYYKKLPKINGRLYKQSVGSNKNFELIVGDKTFSNIFSLGLGSNPKTKIPQKSFKRSLDGVWLYYNVISEQLLKKILKSID